MSERNVHGRLCSVESCPRPASKRGWCGTHYSRWQRHGDVHASSKHFLSFSDEQGICDYLERYSTLDPATDCWIWQRSGGRYGYVRIDGVKYVAHRVSAYLFLGLDIHGPWKVLHMCDRGFCLNPDHLRVGSQLENVRDMISKNRQNKSRGERVNTAKLTAESVRQIRRLHAEGRSYRSVARQFGVSPENVSIICRRLSWNHVL